MKKYIVYIGILVIGLLLGWVIFGNSTNKAEKEHKENEVAESTQMWTCSMHPQIMQPEPGDCPICGMELIPAESGADGLQADQFKLTENAMALANIQTSIVGHSTANADGVKLSGKIIENQESTAVQVSYFSGRIEQLNVGFVGEEVREGQLLATIYSPELYAAQQELITAASLKESQPALYQAVRNKLKLWKLSESQINKIESSGEILENFPVFSTVSGTVSEKLVEQGDYLKQGEPMFKIANLNTVWANFDVYENQIDLFKKGQEVVITTNANPNKEFKGKVSFIDPVLDTRSRTVKLRVVLNNKDDVFKPGMFVEGVIEMVSSTIKQVLKIPSTAILWTGERSVVYVKANPDEPVFEMREVKLGNVVGEYHEILSGLENGDEIVTNGTFTVDAAAQLQGKRSMMNKEGGKETTGHEGHLEMDATNYLADMERLEVPLKFQAQLKAIFDNYMIIENALVNDDSGLSKKGASSLLKSIANVDMKLLKEEPAHSHWMRLEKELNESATEISKTSDIKIQRTHFVSLSAHLINALKTFGINQKVYVDYCPMVNNDVGAFWLSTDKEILNPYFGASMLKCGEIKQTIE